MTWGLLNRVAVQCGDVGANSVINLGAAIDGSHLTAAQAGATTGLQSTLFVSEGSDWQFLEGTFGSSGANFTVSAVLMSYIALTLGTTQMTLGGHAFVRVAPEARSFMLPKNNLSEIASKITAWDNIGSAGADIVASGTLDLDSATGDVLRVTGNTGITAVNLAAGRKRIVHFTGTPTITVSAGLVGNGGGANIAIQADDLVLFRGGSTVVRFTVWRATGKGVVVPAFSDLSFKPTTLAGYGITDALETLGQLAGINPQAGSYSAVLADIGETIEMGGGGTFTFTKQATVAWPARAWLNIVQVGASQVTFAADTGVTLRQRSGYTKTAGQWAMVTAYRRASNEWVLGGDMA